MENENKALDPQKDLSIQNAPCDMKVRVFDLEHGLVEYEKIKFIRIISKEYNLLIMKDYMPIIGEIDGSISIKGENIDLNYDNLDAYYVHHNNEFSLMIRKVN